MTYRETGRIEIMAPDRRKSAVFNGIAVEVVMGGTRLPETENIGVEPLGELGWAPDSKAFFITESYGGLVGDWHVWVYRIENEGVRVINVSQDLVKEFKKHYDTCKPNVGAIKWLKGSRNLLLVAEVPPHSVCPDMGRVRGYIVSIPSGRILQAFGERKLRVRWGRYLGARFRPK